MLKGIDLSNWQRKNYKTLIDKYMPEFVIARATWRKWVDPSCDLIYQYAKIKNKKLGVYFFPLTSDGDPTGNAKWCADQIRGYISQAIFALDWEDYSGSEGTNDTSNVEYALEWLRAFEQATGVKPLIYMNSYCNSKYDFSRIVANDNGLWIANYGNNDSSDHGRPKVKYWPFAAIHQYTSNPIDRDTFYGDKLAWEKYAWCGKPSTVKPVESKTYTQAEMEAIVNSKTAALQDEKDKAIAAQRAAQNIVDKVKAIVNG